MICIIGTRENLTACFSLHLEKQSMRKEPYEMTATNTTLLGKKSIEDIIDFFPNRAIKMIKRVPDGFEEQNTCKLPTLTFLQ